MLNNLITTLKFFSILAGCFIAASIICALLIAELFWYLPVAIFVIIFVVVSLVNREFTP